jgi:hypothetical protein
VALNDAKTKTAVAAKKFDEALELSGRVIEKKSELEQSLKLVADPQFRDLLLSGAVVKTLDAMKERIKGIDSDVKTRTDGAAQRIDAIEKSINGKDGQAGVVSQVSDLARRVPSLETDRMRLARQIGLIYLHTVDSVDGKLQSVGDNSDHKPSWWRDAVAREMAQFKGDRDAITKQAREGKVAEWADN